MFESRNFEQDLIKTLSKVFNEEPRVSFLRYSVNHNYKVSLNGGAQYFCRVYRPHKESAASILAEHDYIQHLKAEGLAVASPVLMYGCNSLLEMDISDSEQVNLSLFDFVEGEHVSSEKWHLTFVKDWG